MPEPVRPSAKNDHGRSHQNDWGADDNGGLTVGEAMIAVTAMTALGGYQAAGGGQNQAKTKEMEEKFHIK